MKKFWRALTILLIAALSLYGAYAFFKDHPSIVAIMQKLMQQMERSQFKNSISKMYKIKGINQNSDRHVAPKKIITKIPGHIYVAMQKPQGPANFDTDNLPDALYSAGPLDTIHLAPGEYHTAGFHTQNPILIKGEGKTPQDVRIIFDGKSSLSINLEGLNKLEMENLTLSSSLTDAYRGPLIEVTNSKLILRDTQILAKNFEMIFKIGQGSELIATGVLFSPGDRGDAIRLTHNARLTVHNTQFKSFRSGITTDTRDFSGEIELDNVEFTNGRAVALSLYSGKCHAKHLKIERIMGAIFLAKNASCDISDSQLSQLETTAIRVEKKSQLSLSRVSMSECGETCILLSDDARLDAEALLLKDGKRAIQLLQGSSAHLNQIEVSQFAIAIYSHLSQLTINLGIFSDISEVGILLKASKLQIGSLSLSHSPIGVSLYDQSELDGKMPTLDKVGEAIKNNFNNSKVNF